jgi:phosphoribosylglycinamide formyltransferase-1
MKKVVIFASGSGSNAENLIQLHHNKFYTVEAIFCNNEFAGVIERANRLKIPLKLFKRNEWNEVITSIKDLNPDLIILAGFLWKIPSDFISSFNRIINIHPSLLPKFGGKGMYGMNVHQAVIDNQEKESGITIHLVNEHYDEGEVLFQAAITIAKGETPESLANKIHELEYKYFPEIILKEIENEK